MTDILGLIFDKDGTLFDFQATWSAWARHLLLDLASGDAERAALLGEAVGYDMQSQRFAPDSPVIAGTPGDVAHALLPLVPGASPLTLIARMNTLAAEAVQVEAAPLRPLLEGLRAQGLKLGLVTNDAEAPARAHLQAAGILDLFDFIAGFDSGHGAKPGPGQLLAFADESGLDPDQVLMIGDSRHDMLAARAAGMAGIGVLTGMATAAELRPFAAEVLQDIGEVPALLGRLSLPAVPREARVRPPRRILRDLTCAA